MPHGSQKIHCIGREAVFDINLVREPLIMKARGIDGLLYIETEIDHPHQNISHRGGDRRPPG